MPKLLVLTRNAVKFAQYQKAFAGSGWNLISLNDVDEPFCFIYPVTRYKRVAIENAEMACRQFGMPVLAEIFGLEIPALKKWPGIGIHQMYVDNTHAMVQHLILEAARLRSDRTADYISAFAFASPRCNTIVVQKKLTGRLLPVEEGEGSWGLDRVFYVTKYRLTLARLSEERFEAVSHRFQAIKELLPLIQPYQ
jgi:XTP/dITP diphosphohydrolase